MLIARQKTPAPQELRGQVLSFVLASLIRVTIPRQSRGLSFVSRSKRQYGVANANPRLLGYLIGGRLAP